MDSRHFVDMYLHGQMHTEEVNEQTDASEICLTSNGEKIEGVRLTLGKYCQCPESARYFDTNDHKCKTAE